MFFFLHALLWHAYFVLVFSAHKKTFRSIVLIEMIWHHRLYLNYTFEWFFFFMVERVADVIAYRSTDAHVIEWIICEDLDPDVVQLWQWHRSIATFCDVATIALCLHIWHSITAYDKWKEEQHFHSFEIFIHAMTMLGNCFSSTIGKIVLDYENMVWFADECLDGQSLYASDAYTAGSIHLLESK